MHLIGTYNKHMKINTISFLKSVPRDEMYTLFYGQAMYKRIIQKMLNETNLTFLGGFCWQGEIKYLTGVQD